jgi:rRNA small subunit pseudouridine methyltransferase Nep1
MLNMIFTEASLELVPKEIIKHPSVKRNAKRRKKPPEETLLERSLHHYAMEHIPDSQKRGRPDILHFCLLLAMGSPLNHQGKLKVSINTLNNHSILVNSTLRPPRDCFRFNRLMEQLFINGSVPPQSQEPLMSIKREYLKKQLNRISPSRTLALSSHGKPSTFKKVASTLSQEQSPAIIIGAYPRGPMNPCVLTQADEVYSVYPDPLEAWTITSRIIYEFEKANLIT